MIVEKSPLEIWLSTLAAPRLIITFLGMIFSTITLSRMLYLCNITRCYSDREYSHVFAIAAGDIIKYQGGHIMRNADARTVRSRQETFNSNHTGQCKRTGGCYNELMVAFFSTGGGVKGKKKLYLLTLLFIYKLAFLICDDTWRTDHR